MNRSIGCARRDYGTSHDLRIDRIGLDDIISAMLETVGKIVGTLAVAKGICPAVIMLSLANWKVR